MRAFLKTAFLTLAWLIPAAAFAACPLSCPHTTYTPPPRTTSTPPPRQTYTPPAPRQTYTPPAPTYNRPAPTYSPPPSYNRPAPTYSPAPSYNRPGPTYSPTPTFNRPAPTYSAPSPTYSHPSFTPGSTQTHTAHPTFGTAPTYRPPTTFTPGRSFTTQGSTGTTSHNFGTGERLPSHLGEHPATITTERHFGGVGASTPGVGANIHPVGAPRHFGPGSPGGTTAISGPNPTFTTGTRHFGGGKSVASNWSAPKRSTSGRTYTYKGRQQPRFRVAPYHWAQGYSYTHYARGMRLPRVFLARRYFILDFLAFGLDPPGTGLMWVRYGPDLLLVNLDTGDVIDDIPGFFEEDSDVADAPLNADETADQPQGDQDPDDQQQ